MKLFKSIAAILILASNLTQAQENVKLENSVLWKIEHSELKEPSYLLGTLHLMCEEDFSISKKVHRVINSVDRLVLEVNLTDPEEMSVAMKLMGETKKISEQLSEKQFQELDSLAQQQLGMPLLNFDDYGLSTFNFLLMSKMLPCTSMKYLETELTQLAVEKQIPINALEKVQEQMSYIEKAYPKDFVFDQMMLFESYKVDFNDAIKFYTEENLTESVNLINKEAYMNENAIEYLLRVRNKNWISRMETMMDEKSLLFAVGSAHLTSEYGLIHLLRENGYTVTPVYN